ISLTVDVPPSVPAELDPEKLQRVFMNLLSNAFKFVPVGGRVGCRLAVREGQAVVTVEDDGPGVQPELRQAIFERFRHGNATALREIGGTGLGLSIAREFVELHAGTIAVDDAPGGGARFTVTLPLDAPAGVPVLRGAGDGSTLVARQVPEELPPDVESPATGRDDGPLVLVVEDNSEMRGFVSEVLGTEYRVATARDGRDGLTKA